MKKMITVLLSISLLSGCSKEANNKPSTSPHANNNAGAITLETYSADFSGYKFLSDNNPPFLSITIEESLKMYEDGGTGIVFYSYDTCPWCNRAIPTLAKAAKDSGIEVFYVDVKEKEFNAKTTNEKKTIVQNLYKDIDSALQTNSNGEKSLEVPLVLAVKDGKIVDSHLGVVSDFELDTSKMDEYQVTSSQEDELYDIYTKMFKEIQWAYYFHV